MFSYEIRDNGQNLRLDTYIFSRSIDLTRSRIQALIKNGHVKVNNSLSKSSYRLKAGDHILVSIPPPSPQVLEPEAVEFSIVYEDSSLIVVDKPAGIVVHPGPGHSTGTLVHGLIRHCRDLSGIGGVFRPGIVHRLDKDTSGLIVAAKNDQSHAFLARQFKTGMVKKQYVAIVHGQVKGDEGEIDLSIVRHPKKRKQMSVTYSGGRRALTLWQKAEVFDSYFSLLLVSIKTGRTHQIRVHLSHTGHPVVGDPVYGYGRNRWKRHPLYKKGLLPAVDRQMLHAKKLGFIHPVEGQYMEFEAPMPNDMDHVVQSLKQLNLR
jgi:23S rRNA pseudouridine1911/1915/1917 synthase